MPAIEYESIEELQQIVAQFEDFNQRQMHAKRLCGNAIKMLRDAESVFSTLSSEAVPGGALEKAQVLTGGWLVFELSMTDQTRTIAEAIAELIAKTDDLHAFMADMQAAYAATGHGAFFTDLPPYGG